MTSLDKDVFFVYKGGSYVRSQSHGKLMGMVLGRDCVLEKGGVCGGVG